MANPLNKSQEKLRGKKEEDMSAEDLKLWIDACKKMENWVKHNKARRSWTESRKKAIIELQKRDKE